MALAVKRAKRGVAFSRTDRTELSGIFDRLSANLRAASAVFLSEDGNAARVLAAEKEVFRDLEARALSDHFAKLREERVNAAPGAMQLDLLRDLKRINTHLVAAAAYPVLEADGALLSSRLRPNPDTLDAAER
jgi:phosphate:Na+ symporter